MARFCTNCGAMLDENGVCNNCCNVYSVDNDTSYDEASAYDEQQYSYEEQPVYDDQIYTDDEGRFVDAYGNPVPPEKLPVMEETPYSFNQSQNDYTYESGGADAQAQYSSKGKYSDNGSKFPQIDFAEIINGSISAAKEFFTSEPTNIIEKSLYKDGWFWTVFALLTALTGSLCMTGIFGNFIKKIFDSALEIFPYASYLFKTYDFGDMVGLFFLSLLFCIISFAAKSGCYHVAVLTSEKKLSFIDSMKAVALSYFPMAIAAAVAYILSFMMISLALTAILAGYLASMSLLNKSVEKQSGEKQSFWYLLLLNVIQAVVSAVFIMITFKIAF